MMRVPWLLILLVPRLLHTQGNYEIQVYGSETVAPQSLMVELHSNFTATGERETIDGVYPTRHQLHETIELTQGITDWSEVGFNFFTSTQSGHGVQWVGDHIRPRVRVPESWLGMSSNNRSSPLPISMFRADWEINFGVGIGATAATDHLIFKAILGRRLKWGQPGHFR